MFREGTTIKERFVISKKIAEGGFGTVFKAYDLRDKRTVAVKQEKVLPRQINSLEDEKESYKKIVADGAPLGIASPIWFGRFGRCLVLAMPLLGRSLADDLAKGCFPLDQVCKIGVQVIKLLEHVHGRGYVHLDIKPDNLVFGKGKRKDVVHLIDFGLATTYRDSTGRHYPYRKDVRFVGTDLYASAHVEEECERSPRDDLESLMYSLVFLYKGKLPWGGRSYQAGRNDVREFGSPKRRHSLTLCKGMTSYFEEAWDKVWHMQFGATPEYCEIRTLLDLACAQYKLNKKLLAKPS